MRTSQAEECREMPWMLERPGNEDARQVRIDIFKQTLDAESTERARFSAWDGQFWHGYSPRVALAFVDKYETAT
jgi:hypothetical protein